MTELALIRAEGEAATRDNIDDPELPYEDGVSSWGVVVGLVLMVFAYALAVALIAGAVILVS